jgi:predicted transposase YdaD
MQNNILKDFLLEHGSEVTNMFLDEWNWDSALKVSFEEGLELGERRGEQRGEQRGLARGEQRGKKAERAFLLDLLRQGCTLEQIERALETESSAGGGSVLG